MTACSRALRVNGTCPSLHATSNSTAECDSLVCERNSFIVIHTQPSRMFCHRLKPCKACAARAEDDYILSNTVHGWQGSVTVMESEGFPTDHFPLAQTDLSTSSSPNKWHMFSFPLAAIHLSARCFSHLCWISIRQYIQSAPSVPSSLAVVPISFTLRTLDPCPAAESHAALQTFRREKREATRQSWSVKNIYFSYLEFRG